MESSSCGRLSKSFILKGFLQKVVGFFLWHGYPFLSFVFFCKVRPLERGGQIFARYAKICRGNRTSYLCVILGGVMQRLAEEFHKLLVAGSNPAPATIIEWAMNTKYEFESVLSFTAVSVVAILMMTLWSLVLAWPVQLLWNWLVPGIFGLGRITSFQAFALKVLLGLTLGKVTIEDKRKKGN